MVLLCSKHPWRSNIRKKGRGKTSTTILKVSFQKHRNWLLYGNKKNGLQKFQIESCQPIKRMKDKNDKKDNTCVVVLHSSLFFFSSGQSTGNAEFWIPNIYSLLQHHWRHQDFILMLSFLLIFADVCCQNTRWFKYDQDCLHLFTNVNILGHIWTTLYKTSRFVHFPFA